MNNTLRKNGWLGRYLANNNNVYGKKKQRLSGKLVGVILEDIYGDEVCVDPDFINTYLEMQGLDDKYYLTNGKTFNKDIVFDLTEWIPIVEEINEYQEGKTKKKRF